MSTRISGKILRETDAAIQIHDYATEEDVWFPLSQVEEIHRDANGVGWLLVTDWIARKKGYDVQ